MKKQCMTILLLIATVSLFGAEKLTLEQCIQAAIKNNKSLQQGSFSVQQTALGTKSAYASLYPSASASASESGGNGSSKLGANAGINQSLYSPGLYSEIKLAKNKTDVAKLDKEELEAEIRASVETAYYNILTYQGLINVYRENLTAAAENLQLIRTMYKLGTRTESDVLKAEVQKGEIENTLINQEHELISEKRSLAVLMGDSPEQEFEIVDIDVEQMNIPDLTKAKNLLLKNSLEYQSLQKSLKNEQISLKIAKEAYLPNISAGYNYSKDWTGATTTDGYGSWSISASIGIFDGFSKKQNVQKSKLSLKSAEVGLQAKEQELLSTLLNYYSDLDNKNRIIDLQEKTLESARKNYELVTRQYELGMATMLEQTTAQVSVLQAQSNLVKAKYSRKIVESQIRQLLAL
jgi:outer membrane protein